MARVVDHLSVAELQHRFRAYPDPVEAWHVRTIWLLAKDHTIGASSKVTTLGTRWVEQLPERYHASGPEALANGGRRNFLAEPADAGGAAAAAGRAAARRRAVVEP